MDWNRFNTYGLSSEKAFETLCCSLFEKYCRRIFKDNVVYFTRVNGDGGDGGIEAYTVLKSCEIIALQTKWFRNTFGDAQITQIQRSLDTAVKIRSSITQYIVCIPRDLSSRKVVKGNKTTLKTQEQRWNEFIINNKSSYSNIEIILWNDQRITEELTNIDSQGLVHFWFENVVIDESEMKDSFQKAVLGWAQTKYIPDLYSQGYIHKELEEFLLDSHIVEQRKEILTNTIVSLRELRKAYLSFNEFVNYSDNIKNIREAIEQDIFNIDKLLNKLILIYPAIENGQEYTDDSFYERLDVTDSIRLIKNSVLFHHFYFHFREIEKSAENIEELLYDCRRLFSGYDENRCIFLGDMGAGKTVAIVDEIDGFIKNQKHFPILVHATDFSTGNTWKDIVEKTLGLASNWNESELFNALEAAAMLRDTKGFVSKCIICVDSLDESSSYSFWKEKIKESAKFQSKFKRIKFVFLSRPYVFDYDDRASIGNCFDYLPSSGDVDVRTLLNDYMSYYNIDIGQNSWIVQTLQSPLSLKLFCDIYKNQSIDSIDKSSLVITNLCKAKIELSKKEFSGRHPGCESVFHDVLITMARLFVDNIELTIDIIHSKIERPYTFESVENAVNYIAQLGFVFSRSKETQDVLESPRKVYGVGFQPLFEYMIASALFREIEQGDIISNHYTEGVYQMLSILFLEKNILIGSVKNISLDSDLSLNAELYALRSVPMEIASSHYTYLMKMMSESPLMFRHVYRSVIVPCSKTKKHPLGGKLLDEFLSDFKKPAQRDVWWSIPEVLRDSMDNSTYISIDLTKEQLTDQDLYTDIPIIICWLLTSVNNETRYRARLQLTRWGMNDSHEFISLFLHFVMSNDMQLVEDIFAVTYGICLDINTSNEFLSDISYWCSKNVFSKKGLNKYCNTAIRFYARGIIEISIGRKVVDPSKLNKYYPPYSVNYKFPNLFKAAINSERMRGFGPIDYDLARYVLCDPLDVFFRENYHNNRKSKEISEFISHYSNKYEIEDIHESGLIISIAYQFLIGCGWKKEYYDYSDKANLGVDLAIRYTYHFATHGAQSSIMTIAEKFVWVFRHYFFALLSDVSPVSDYDCQFAYVQNYNSFENFNNTYQDLINEFHTQTENKWIHTKDFARECMQECSAIAINQWISNAPLPNYKAWLFNNDDEVLLYTFTDVRNEEYGIEEAVWISSGLIKKSDYAAFLEQLNCNLDLQVSLMDPHRFMRYMEGRMCSPQEVCLVSGWKESDENSVESELCIMPLLTSVLSSHHEKTEKEFVMPSKIAREILHIKCGDGYYYYDEKDVQIARYCEIGHSMENQQEYLLVDSSEFDSSIDSIEYYPFWLCRTYRDSTPKAKEVFGSELVDHFDKSCIIINENGAIKEIELHEPKNLKSESKPSGDYNAVLKLLFERYNKDNISTEDKTMAEEVKAAETKAPEAKKPAAKKTAAKKPAAKKAPAAKKTTAKKAAPAKKAAAKKTTAKAATKAPAKKAVAKKAATKKPVAKKVAAKKPGRSAKKKLGKVIFEIDGQQIDYKALEKKAAKLGGDVYVVTNEKKIFDKDGKSVDIF